MKLNLRWFYWVCAGLVVPASASATSGSFSKQEAQALQRGELVVRKKTDQHHGLKLIGGASWQVIDVPVDVVWRAIRDVKHYHQMIPRLEQAKVVAKKGPARTVQFTHRGPFAVRYALVMTNDKANRRVTFHLDPQRSGPLEATWGYLLVRPYEDGSGKQRTLLNYGVMVDIGSGPGRSLLRPLLHDKLFTLSKKIKKYSEQTGIQRYKKKKANKAPKIAKRLHNKAAA